MFVDTETTGLNHLSRPWEIAVILRSGETTDGDRPAEVEYVRHIRYPLMNLPEGTDPGALEMNGWWDRGTGAASMDYLERLVEDQHVDAGAGSEAVVAYWLHPLLQDATLVGVGIHYDAEVLGRMFLRHGLPWQPWDYDIRDLKTQTRGHIQGFRRLGARVSIDPLTARSDDLAAWAGVRPPTAGERHTALGDARWAARWFDALEESDQ